MIDFSFFQELKELHEDNRVKLETTIDCLRSEIKSEQSMKEEVEKHMEELANELDKVEHEMVVLRDDQRRKLDQLQKKYSSKIQGFVEKSEKLAAENFEYAVENVRF